MSNGYGGCGVCGVCNREIPMKRDGRLRAHLALTSSPGRREQCDGSGSKAAQDRDVRPLTRPAAFNAREEWLKADALYAEWQDILQVGAASPGALRAARAAVQRTVADARHLAPWWAVAQYEGEGYEP
ncbi:MAG: hypothetical protein ACTHPS_13420 [Streptosporangiaceae bacterium]